MSQSSDMCVDDEEKEPKPTSDDYPVSESFSQFPSESDPSMHALSRQRRVSTPVSILIESLVKNICSMCEPDKNKASLMYELICDKLFAMNLIDESYSMREFEGMRSQYMKAFLQLVTSVKSGDKNLPLRSIWPTPDINSHYLREFDEVEYIAGGGFGQVYRVKHKLDGANTQ
ncbi:hypothetical protein NQ318_014248 [Aromia moschata]|uniref:non-specific serine/threonine protein kinase n=1 Tax=Aromia moschata TaxID=1265417 RepID=A0AAV8YYH1_9CUCU|nr:hypothetical protein NQ318_014248 [Aromia moschata]